MLSRPLLVLTIAEALTDQSESKQEDSGGTASNASSESQSEPQTSQSLSDIRYMLSVSYLQILQNPLKLFNHLTVVF